MSYKLFARIFMAAMLTSLPFATVRAEEPTAEKQDAAEDLAAPEKKTPTEQFGAVIEKAKTVHQLEADINNLEQRLQREYFEAAPHNDDEAIVVGEEYFALMKAAAEAKTAAGEKMLTELADNDWGRGRGYRFKIEGLKNLIRYEPLRGSEGGQESMEKNQKTLDDLIDAIEKEGKHPGIVDNERCEQFLHKTFREMKTLSPEGFTAFKEELKAWINKNLARSNSPQNLCEYAVGAAGGEALLKADPDLPAKTFKEMRDFVASDDCTLDKGIKGNLAEWFEKVERRSPGSELKLYGRTLDDKEIDWDSYRGKYVLVKFTSSWCGPCKGEIPGLLEAYEKYHDKGFDVVSVGIWDTTENLKKLMEKEKLPWAMISEDLTDKSGQPKLGDNYAIRGVPTMLFIDKDGKIVAEMRSDTLLKKLAELFPESRDAATGGPTAAE